MHLLGQAGAILAAAVLAGAGTHFLHPRAPVWHAQEEKMKEDEVSLASIQQRWQGDVVWVDARLRKDYAAEHVPGAILINEQETDQLLFENFGMLQDNKKPLVVYCSGQSCQASRKIADYLRERLPLTEIYVLKGGWNAWKAGQKNGGGKG